MDYGSPLLDTETACSLAVPEKGGSESRLPARYGRKREEESAEVGV